MTLTKELAACSIYAFEITTENKEKAMNLLQKAELVPVHLANGDPTLAVAVGIKKVKTEPWKYKEFKSEENEQNKGGKYDESDKGDKDKKSEDSSNDSYEILVPQSRRSVVHLLKMITSPEPIQNVTYERFLTEEDLYEIVKAYFGEINFSSNQLNDWLGKECLWGSTKKKAVDGKRIRGRTIHLVRQDLRDFSWNDISNVKEFRKLVRESAHETVTIGYVRKSKSNTREAREAKETIERSINLQVAKMKTKLLCKYVFASCNANAEDKIADRDCSRSKKQKYNIIQKRGDCQDMMDFITMSNKKVRLVIIDYAGLSTNPDDIKEFGRKHKQLKEIVVDEGHKVSSFSRFEFLKEDKIVQKFNCRTGSVKRSL